MNFVRFIGKVLTSQASAWRSVKLVSRSAYGRLYWRLYPTAPLRYALSTGGTLWLEPSHSFTTCFWPAVDQYEPDVRAALLHFLKPGATFVDCGANVGYFSVMAQQIVGSRGLVVSIEANPATFSLLERNLACNGDAIAINCALMSHAAETQLFVPREGDVYSSLRKGGLVGGEGVQTIRVTGRTLDQVAASLQLRRLDLLKVDIEGGELDVLRSATRVIRDLRPVVVCEYGTNTWPAFGATAEQLTILMREHDYSIGTYDVSRQVVVPAGPQVWNSAYANLVLMPNPVGSVHLPIAGA